MDENAEHLFGDLEDTPLREADRSRGKNNIKRIFSRYKKGIRDGEVEPIPRKGKTLRKTEMHIGNSRRAKQIREIARELATHELPYEDAEVRNDHSTHKTYREGAKIKATQRAKFLH